ncbi:MAG: hypothetical protein ABIH66_06470, partial [bacterium]
MDAALFEKNMRLLGERPHFVTGIREAGSPGLEFEPIDTRAGGRPSLRATYCGERVTLHSAYDPVREAETLVAGKEFGGAETLLVFGFGLGYHCEAALRLHPGLKKMIVIDVVPALFR